MKNTKLTKTLLITCLAIALLLVGILSGCQQEKPITIGITQIVDHPSLDNCRQGSIDKLAELGYVEGEDFVIKYESAQGDPSVANTIAQQFVGNKVDLILAISTPSAQAAYGSALKDGIPVVFSAVSDPIAAEIAAKDGASLSNITGTSDEMPMDESFKLIQRILPQAKKVGILHNTSEVNSDVQLALAQKTAESYGMEVIDMGISSTNEVASALDVLLPQIDILLNLTDNMVVSAMPLIAERTMEANIPIVGSEDEQVKKGALASAGIDYYNLGAQTGEMVAKILDGTPAEEIAIETLKDVRLAINLDVAQKLGITLPEDLIKQSDVVIDGE